MLRLFRQIWRKDYATNVYRKCSQIFELTKVLIKKFVTKRKKAYLTFAKSYCDPLNEYLNTVNWSNETKIFRP